MTSNTFPKNKIKKAYPIILPHYEKKNMNSIYSPKKLLLNNVLLVEFSVYYSIMFYILSWRKEKNESHLPHHDQEHLYSTEIIKWI